MNWNAYQIPKPWESDVDSLPPVSCLECGDDALEGGDYCRYHQDREDKAREEDDKERAGYRGPWED